MTTHQLAQFLLTTPNAPVLINGWGSDEGFTFEVSGAHSNQDVRAGNAVFLDHGDVPFKFKDTKSFARLQEPHERQ